MVFTRTSLRSTSELPFLTGQSSNHISEKLSVGSGILLQLDSLQEEEGLRFRLRSWRVNAGAEPLGVTILFIPLSALPHKLESDWAGDCDKINLPQCPVCDQGSIIGHGRRRKRSPLCGLLSTTLRFSTANPEMTFCLSLSKT